MWINKRKNGNCEKCRGFHNLKYRGGKWVCEDCAKVVLEDIYKGILKKVNTKSEKEFTWARGISRVRFECSSCLRIFEAHEYRTNTYIRGHFYEQHCENCWERIVRENNLKEDNDGGN